MAKATQRRKFQRFRGHNSAAKGWWWEQKAERVNSFLVCFFKTGSRWIKLTVIHLPLALKYWN